MGFYPGYDYDDFGSVSGWPWGFASTPRGGGYSYADPYDSRRAYYPGRKSFYMPSQNYGRRAPPHARGPAYEYDIPISDGWNNHAQAPVKKQNASRPAHVKKHANAPQVTRVVPISEPASSKAPVCRFVAKEDAAIKIQSVFRGYSVRHTKPLWSLRKIAETKGKLVDFKDQVSDPEKMRLVRENMKERILLTEGVMNLLLQLDSIQGALPIVREIRKATVREIVQLQEKIDSILQQKELEKPSESESSEGANGEMELEKPLESELESSEGADGEMEEELKESSKQMESSLQVPVKAGDESMDSSACDNAEAGQEAAAEIIKDEEDFNIVDDNLEAAQDTGADNVEAAGDSRLQADEMVDDQQAQDSEKDAAMMGEDMGDHEAAENTGDNLEAAQDTGAVNIIKADEMVDDQQAQDSEQDAAVMMGDDMGDHEAAQNTGAVNTKGDNVEAAEDTAAVNNMQEDRMVDDYQAQDSEKDAACKQVDLKTQALSLEETDGEESKQGMLEMQAGVEATQDENVSAMEVEGECRRIVDAVVDEAVHNAEAEVCASRKREREEQEAGDKAGPDEYMKIMVKLVDENAQLKKLVADCLKQTELQNALICHLNDRVQKLEKKAKRNCNKKKNAKLPDLF